jgi:hypothetical protein
LLICFPQVVSLNKHPPASSFSKIPRIISSSLIKIFNYGYEESANFGVDLSLMGRYNLFESTGKTQSSDTTLLSSTPKPLRPRPLASISSKAPASQGLQK